MIFRWSLWGKHKIKSHELLYYSIASFRKQFGKEHRYIVYTDDVSSIPQRIKTLAKVRQFPNDNKTLFVVILNVLSGLLLRKHYDQSTHSQVPVLFNVQSKATWLKWCPNSRIDINETEFFIDSDVFLLKYPDELDAFLSNQQMKFAIMDEFKGQSWQHGAMQRRASSRTPFVNAGFFIQKAKYDITPDLLREFDWWKNNIKKKEQTHHDEQGALAIALTKYLLNNELYILPKDKYILIGENENTDKENLDGITLLHAVYPDHPAFYKFKNCLDKILNE